MPVELVRADALSEQVPYAYAAVVGPGPGVHRRRRSRRPRRRGRAGDVAGQAQRVMVTSSPPSPRPGARWPDVAKSTVYVASHERADLVAAWQVVRAAFGDHDAPPTLLGVAALGYADQLVEVEAVAARS